jgi:uroporphyrin-III C-methyltransferase / precorrin-2 dehydrogenase / sirohydrochlorin ferrochelatase
MYPVTLCLTRVACLVVGGGEVAARKVTALLREDARVTVVAPETVGAIRSFAEAGTVRLERRRYRPGEATAYRLVFAATDECEVNRQVHDDAVGAGIWVNVADDPELCSFHLPARVERGPLQIALASGGGAPFVVRRLRELLERWFPPHWGEWAAAAARFRDLVRAAGLPGEQREALFDRFFAETVDPERLRARAPHDSEMRAWVDGGAVAPPSPKRAALVSLVGAGPGNGGLLTLRGHRRVMDADAVVYDRLAEPALPCDLAARVELYPVGKEAGNHPVPQDEINALLVSLARAGKRVVRFKGGDPYTFGRGSEEAMALRAAGIDFEVVPGVTAGVAGAAWAGVPATHRGIASRVTLFTAHPSADGASLSRNGVTGPGCGATMIGYMGVSNLAAVVRELVGGGIDGATPAMLLERATTARQRCVKATLATLPEAAERESVRPPALIFVGDAVALSEEVDWHARLPLVGQRLVLASPAGSLGDELELAGAEVLVATVPLSPAARIPILALPVTGWLARDGREAAALGEGIRPEQADVAAVAWCLGAEAAAAARSSGWERIGQLPGGAPETVVRALAEWRRP